jgi:phage tail-like protein
MAGRKDPLISPRFVVTFGSHLTGSFREVTVVSAETEPAEYKFTDDQGNPGYYAVPGRMKYGHITLKRGMTDDMSMWKWRKQVEDGDIEGARTSGSIFLKDQKGATVAQFDFTNAWPLKVSNPGGNANSNDIVIEEAEIICEGLKRVS